MGRRPPLGPDGRSSALPPAGADRARCGRRRPRRLGRRLLVGSFGAAASRGHAHGPGYGPLGAPDANGIRLPAGFRSRLVARGGRPVGESGYVWHEASDGAATFPLSGGGWILVSNSEASRGGASAIRFAPDGTVRDAYRILEGTVQNCSGGGTPWGTWLSCEEVQNGLVWECDPAGGRRARARPAMGVFKHEAAAVDPVGRRVYLTEDLEDGCLYRFTPERWPRLESGVLEVARVDSRGGVEWLRVPDPAARRRHTRDQVPGAARFKRAEGIFLDDGVLYVATTLDSRIHAYDLRRGRIEVVYDGLALARPPLTIVDQLSVSPGGELYACEDNSEPDIDVAVVDRRGRVARFLTLTGPVHSGSEATGIAPSTRWGPGSTSPRSGPTGAEPCTRSPDRSGAGPGRRPRMAPAHPR